MSIPNPAKFGRICPDEWSVLPEHYTNCLWPDELPSNPRDYGDNNFHGRTHPEIIRVALQRYAKPGDVVWDPMAGSGTTIDVCNELDCKCLASDLNPVRQDIIAADARTYKPPLAIDLVVLHPPYMSIVPYSKDDNDLSTMDHVQFLNAMYEIFGNVTESLKMYHVLVLIVGSLYGNVSDSYKEVVPLDMDLWGLLSGHYRLLGRVFRTYGETKGGKTAGKKNENLWKYRRLKYGIWSLGIETVLFLQRVI